jgi:uncharacterized membrane protein
MLEQLWPVIVTTLAPVAELRGGIPLGIAMGLDPALVIATAFIVNCLVFFPVYIGLTLLYERFFIRFAWCRKLIERIHKKGRPYVERYGILGLAVFVGIPLPATGAWTGTGIAWVLGLDWKRSFLAVCLGVLIAAVIVSAVSLGVLGAVSS